MQVKHKTSFAQFYSALESPIKALAKNKKKEEKYKEEIADLADQFHENLETRRAKKKLNHWYKAFEEIRSSYGHYLNHTKFADDTIRNLRKHGNVLHAIILHYRFHAELSHMSFAEDADRVFKEQFGSFPLRLPLFTELSSHKLNPSFPENIRLSDSYQYARPEFRTIKAVLLSDRTEPGAVTASVKGAGGYGKTSIAEEICLDAEIRSKFRCGIYWLQFGVIEENEKSLKRFRSEEMAVTAMLAAQYGKETAQTVGRCSLKLLLDLLPSDGGVLLVADDLWAEHQNLPFRTLPDHVTTLFTTRQQHLEASTQVEVKKLSHNDAYKLISYDIKDLNEGEARRLDSVCHHLKGWPLVIKIVNRTFRQLQLANYAVAQILHEFERRLEVGHLEGWDEEHFNDEVQDAKRRNLVGSCIDVGIDALLPPKHRYLINALAVFPEDTEIPYSIAIDYFIEISKRENSPCSESEAFNYLFRFQTYSFFRSEFGGGKTFIIHDEILACLRYRNGENKIKRLHLALVAAIEKHCPDGWASLPADHRYGWCQLHNHLEMAERGELANQLRSDFRWIQAKFNAVGLVELQSTYNSASLNSDAEKVGHAIYASTHVLASWPEALALQLYGRLAHERSDTLIATSDEALNHKSCWPVPLIPHLPRLGPKVFALKFSSADAVDAKFSPSGQFIATSYRDGTLLLWSVETGLPLSAPVQAHQMQVSSLHFSKDGTKIITTAEDCSSKIWTVANGLTLYAELPHFTKLIHAEFSLDGSKIVTVSSFGTVTVWDVSNDIEIASISLKDRNVTAASFNPDGSKILITYFPDMLWGIWNYGDGGTSFEISHENAFQFCAFTRDGTEVVAVDFGQQVLRWDAETLRPVTSSASITCPAISFDYNNPNLVAFPDSEAVYVFHTIYDQELWFRLELGDFIHSADLCAAKNLIVTVSRDGQVETWDYRKHAVHFDQIMSGLWLTVSGDGSHAMLLSAGGSAQIWRLPSGESVSEAFQLFPGGKLYGDTGLFEQLDDLRARHVSFNFHGTEIIVREHINEFRIKDTKSMSCILKLNYEDIKYPSNDKSVNSISGVEFIGKTNRLSITVDFTNTIIWDYKENIAVGGSKNLNVLPFYRFDRLGQKRVLSIKQNAAVVQILDDWRDLDGIIEHADSITDFDFNEDSSKLLSSSVDGTVIIWSVVGSCEKSHTLQHFDEVNSARFSLDGSMIVTSSNDGNARVWKAACETKPFKTLEHSASVKCAVINEDNSLVITTSSECIIHIWELETSTEIARLHLDEMPSTLKLNGDFICVDNKLCFDLSRRGHSGRFDAIRSRWQTLSDNRVKPTKGLKRQVIN